jgi:AcrR family transcriptional regulator
MGGATRAGRLRRAVTPARGRAVRARGQETSRRLLDAGAAVFADRGYHAARVDDIVKAARTSHGTFYLYFSSKDELFRALALDVAAAMAELARELPALTGDQAGYAALRAWLDRFQALYGRYGPVIRTWTEAEIVDSDMGRIGRDLVAEFSRELAQRLRTAAPDLDPQVAAFALVAMIERSAYYLEARQLRVSRDALLATLATVTHAGLYGGPARLPEE